MCACVMVMKVCSLLVLARALSLLERVTTVRAAFVNNDWTTTIHGGVPGAATRMRSCRSPTAAALSLSVSSSIRTTGSSVQLPESGNHDRIEWRDADTRSDLDMKSVVKSLGEYLHELEQLAKITSTDPTVVQQANALFEELHQAHVVTQDSTLAPTILAIYNKMMEIHAFSPHAKGAEQAAMILHQLLLPNSNIPPLPLTPEATTTTTTTMSMMGAATPLPNRESFGNVMDAWIRRRRLDKVEELLQEMKELNNPNLQPNIYIYNKIIKVRGVCGKAESALALLEELLETSSSSRDNNSNNENNNTRHDSVVMNEVHDPTTRPNQKTWVQVMRAYASPRQAAHAAGVAQIEALMGRMARGFRTGGESDWKPGILAYNALLMALGHAKGSAKEAERVLYTIIEQCRKGDVDMRPTNDSFFNVLRAFQNEKSKGVIFKVEKLLQLQDALAQSENDESLRPNAKVLSAAMVAISRARDSAKAVKALRILERMKHDFESSGKEEFAPTMFHYKSLLNSCAFSSSSVDPEEKLRTFKIAVDTLNAIRNSPALVADSSVVGLFLKACGKLMPPTKKRDAVIDSVFRKCCQDGYVNEYVLRQFESAASGELQLKLLGGFLDDGVEVPSEWRRNAQ